MLSGKDSGKAMGVWVFLLRNMSTQQACGPAIAKTMVWAKTLSTLPLGMEKKVSYLCLGLCR